ncbi:MAG: RAMP superfamily CRISPR-associated protein, partial [Candidatus Caldarchaeum sp.]|nr:RAMP superfamily CRISPR-associated protein [Candidatus Caldarchaeum sp.]
MTIYWTSSRVLLRETIVEGELVNLSPLRVGAGREPPLGAIVDLVVRIRLGEAEVPYIPGSSLKGVFRTYAMGIARRKGLDTCTGLSKSTCYETKSYVDDSGKRGNLGDYIETELKSGRTESAMKAFFTTACLMCKIFGAPTYASKAVFSDAYPVS